jgi:hypothetical protein
MHLFLILISCLAFATASINESNNADPKVIKTVETISDSILEHGSEALNRLSPSDQSKGASALVSMEAKFRNEAPTIIESNYQAFQKALDGQNGRGQPILALTFAKKTVKELINAITEDENANVLEKRYCFIMLMNRSMYMIKLSHIQKIQSRL